MADTAPSDTPPRSPWRGLKVLATIVLAIVALMALMVGGALWLLRTSQGTSTLLGHLPGVQVQGPEGALWGDFASRRVEVELTPGMDGKRGDWLVLTNIRWRGLSLDLKPSGPPWLHVHVDELTADTVDATISPKPDADPTPPAMQPPRSLRLPVTLDIGSLRVGNVRATPLGDTPLRDLRAKIDLGVADNDQHRIDDLSVAWGKLLTSGSLHIGMTSPMAVASHLDVRQVDDGAAAAGSAPGSASAGRSASAPSGTSVSPSASSSASASGAASSPNATAAAPGVAASAPAPSPSGTASVGLPFNDLTASLDVNGPLERPLVQATLRARGQALDARATLLPFAAWPLADLDATVEGLDLSAVHAAAPSTSLSGGAHATTTGRGEPASVTLDLRNDAAGQWDAGKLPLRSVKITAQGRPSDPSAIELHAFDAALGTRSEPGGRIAGSGEWRDGNWSLDAALDEIQPAVLDARMAAMRLSGPLVLSGRGFAAATSANPSSGLPSSSPSRSATPSTASPAAPRSASTPALPSSAPSSPLIAAAERPTIDLRTELTGRVQLPGSKKAAGPVRAVELRVDASANDQHIELRRVEANSGGARASLSGTATRADANAAWQVAAKLGLTQFDPTPWWQVPADSPWREGPHRINATVVANVTVPAALTAPSSASGATAPSSGSRPATGTGRAAGAASASTSASPLADLHGNVTLTIGPSLLAGVPVSGNAKVVSASTGHELQADAMLNAAGNTVSLNGKLATSGNGSTDRWQVDIKAPSVASIAPLIRLAQPAGPPMGISGSLTANGQVQGRWPAVSTAGQLNATALQFGPASVAQTTARWQLGTAADAVLDLQVDVSNVVSGQQRLDSATVQLKGTAASHTLQARARAPALPPQWVDSLRPPRTATASTAIAPAVASSSAPASTVVAPRIAAAPASAPSSASASSPATTAPSTSTSGSRGTQAVLMAEGGVIGDVTRPAAISGWRGKLRQLDVSDTTGANPPWVHVDPVAIDIDTGAAAPKASVSAGRANILGAGLRWSQVAWQGGAQPRLDAQAVLEPLLIAPILAALQPEFGWSGDLALSGKLQVQSAPQLTASMELVRDRGDLRVADNAGLASDAAAIRSSQALGLSQLRIAADVQNGTWRFTQALTSSNFGVVSGSQTVRTSPQAMWPAPDAPLEGTLSARVANLGSLSPWIPANWRLSGKLETNARIGGKFGAPEYTGEVVGSEVGVRNLLEGVTLSDGDLRIALQGTTAKIERFHVTAGKGSANLTGGASFGTAPQANLNFKADKFQVLGRVDRRIAVSGDASLKMDAKTLALDGAFRLDEGLIDFTRSDAPTLSDDVTVVRVTNKEKAQEAATTDPAVNRNVSINVKLDLGDNLRIKGRGIDTGLGGDLKMTSPDGRLAVNGTIGTIGGTYNAYGQKLSIDRGVLIFNGPVGNPRLDIEATRPDIDTRVGVQVTGYALTPRIRLFSDSAMSDTDKLSWLVLGKAPDSLGRSDTALLQRAAMGLLSGEGPGATDSMIKSLGLDDVSVGQQTEGDVKQTVVSLGKQLSKRWYVGYERSLNGTAGGWQLIYRVAQRFTLRATTGEDSSLDMIWVWRWN